MNNVKQWPFGPFGPTGPASEKKVEQSPTPERKWVPADYQPDNKGIDSDLGHSTHESLNGGIWSP